MKLLADISIWENDPNIDRRIWFEIHLVHDRSKLQFCFQVTKMAAVGGSSYGLGYYFFVGTPNRHIRMLHSGKSKRNKPKKILEETSEQ